MLFQTESTKTITVCPNNTCTAQPQLTVSGPQISEKWNTEINVNGFNLLLWVHIDCAGKPQCLSCDKWEGSGEWGLLLFMRLRNNPGVITWDTPPIPSTPLTLTSLQRTPDLMTNPRKTNITGLYLLISSSVSLLVSLVSPLWISRIDIFQNVSKMFAAEIILSFVSSQVLRR